MALGIERAIAELLRDGDPSRSIQGLYALEGFRLYDDPDASARNIFVGEEKQQPDEMVSVFAEGGGMPIGGGGESPVGRQPSFTVRARSPKYERAIELAFMAYGILEYYQGVVHGISFFRIFANSDPSHLGRDREDRTGRFYTTQTFRAVTKRFVLS